MKKYYQILGLEKGASKQDIQDAYDKLSAELDPKNNDDLDFFKEEFALLQEAYKKLMGHVPERIDNESSEKKVEDTERESNTNSSKMALGDDETLISLFKKYLDLGVKEKKEMVEVLEELQSYDKKYLDALQLIYKTEGVESFKEFIAKQSNKKETSPKQQEPSKPLGVKKPAKNTDKPLIDNDKNKKIIIRLLLAIFLLVFGITYLIFQNKVEKVKTGIPIIEKKELERNEQRKNYWKDKFNIDFPNLGSFIEDKGTNSGGLIDYRDAELIKDTVVRFFVFSSSIPYNSFNECYWECLYFHAINRINFLPGKEEFDWDDEMMRKYKITKDDYWKIIDMVKNSSSISKNSSLSSIGYKNGEYFSYFPKHLSPTLKDKECTQCIPNFTETYSMNNIAIKEFESFLTQYLKNKKTVDAANRVAERGYKLEFDNLTSGMSYSLKNKVRSKVEARSLSTSKKIYHNYYGTNNGIGDIRYSFDKKEYATSSLDDIVNDVYKEYYSDNSLYTGATPYSYCYGGNPYCSPPRGYAECSFIDVRASSNSDVIVIIKKNNRVYSHAYIKAGGYYKFKLGNGSFQTFFYYGKGWNPNKYIKNANCGKITGGFVNNESLDKSEVEYLNNSSISYTLYSVQNGNFRPKSSNKNEAF